MLINAFIDVSKCCKLLFFNHSNVNNKFLQKHNFTETWQNNVNVNNMISFYFVYKSDVILCNILKNCSFSKLHTVSCISGICHTTMFATLDNEMTILLPCLSTISLIRLTNNARTTKFLMTTPGEIIINVEKQICID